MENCLDETGFLGRKSALANLLHSEHSCSDRSGLLEATIRIVHDHDRNDINHDNGRAMFSPAMREILLVYPPKPDDLLQLFSLV